MKEPGRVGGEELLIATLTSGTNIPETLQEDHTEEYFLTRAFPTTSHIIPLIPGIVPI